MYLEKINSPKDVKKLNIQELNVLCGEIREVLIKKLSEHGGHIGPNLGSVELTVALHYVFDSPKDKIVYDVSHQSYTHKILTGRKEAFMDSSKYDSVTGYTNPKESEHDFFEVGHTSTSLSLACGLAKARDLKGESGNIIALIGDGSLSGGEAFEGLNNIIENNSNAIIIVNDNEMSIAENHGGLYNNLRDLRESNGNAENNFFKTFGYDYMYVNEGNNVEELINALNSVKDSQKAVVVHVHTNKGNGLSFAENNKESWHFGMPFNRETGETCARFSEDSYNYITGEYIYNKIKEDKKVVAVTAGTPSIFCFDEAKRKECGGQFVDAGIAEEHVIAFSSAVAKAGCVPVFSVYSSFIQRTYDQISHDLCINNNPAVLIVFSGSVYGMNDKTHAGLYDIAMLSNIPNLVYLAPTCKEEYLNMLNYATTQKEHPVAVRVPGLYIEDFGMKFDTDYSKLNKFEVVKQGSDVAILGLGTFFKLGLEVTEELEKFGVNATLINPRFISGIDEELLTELSKNHKLIITLEDGIVEGGFGQKVASYLGTSDVKVKNFGLKKAFEDKFVADELLRKNGISVEQITEYIKNTLK